jgi:hypothetical protein
LNLALALPPITVGDLGFNLFLAGVSPKEMGDERPDLLFSLD